ncbi:MAG: outer membrane protein assembly factor BamB [Planctomycetota bacterium]|jgi:outer membrane protein assembly factor BamB
MADLSKILNRVLFVGGHGFVTAMDKESGDEIWRTSLKGSGYHFVNLLLEDNSLFAASGGKLYCLSADTGDVLWVNSMSGLGYGIFSFASSKNPGGSTGAAAAQQAASSSSNSPTSGHSG